MLHDLLILLVDWTDKTDAVGVSVILAVLLPFIIYLSIAGLHAGLKVLWEFVDRKESAWFLDKWARDRDYLEFGNYLDEKLINPWVMFSGALLLFPFYILLVLLVCVGLLFLFRSIRDLIKKVDKLEGK